MTPIGLHICPNSEELTHPMTDKRLIEEAFPLKQASIDSVHEKNVRHGHISTLHIWPARRPLAACRAALIAALLPDPGDAKARQDLVRRIGGQLKTQDGVDSTEGGVLRWGREQSRDMEFFRQEIRKAFDGRTPKVLDMFAGGGAIPLEAMRLGCDVTAVDYNPVAWFILKCTLEYPSQLAGKKWPLPSVIGSAPEPDLQSAQGRFDGMAVQPTLGEAVSQTEGDLAAHVRYWGNWVLERARQDLASYYPTLPLHPEKPVAPDNPLCPTVAYLWARTIPHPDPKKNGLQIPLLKTLWLCKKEGKKRALRMIYNAEANRFDFTVFRPWSDSEVGPPTMTRKGVQCPPTEKAEFLQSDVLVGDLFLPMDYLQRCGKEGKLNAVCTAVVVDVPKAENGIKGGFVGKEYRTPTPADDQAIIAAATAVDAVFSDVPFGLPREPIDSARPSPNARGASGLTRYGLCEWVDLFTCRQLLALGTFVTKVREAHERISASYTQDGEKLAEALSAYLAIAVDRLADRSSTICRPDPSPTQSGIINTFSRFALPMTWDFIEGVTIEESSGGFYGAIEWVAKVVAHACGAAKGDVVEVFSGSATQVSDTEIYDLVATDPPYYDAIPYADLSDFFYVWLRRTVGDIFPNSFNDSLTPKSGELIQHAGRMDGDNKRAKQFYEDGMAAAFAAAFSTLRPDGRLVVVFAHKQPDAWETLVGAMIRAGFVVTASWPIDTEMTNKVAGIGQARLSSSVWLVSRKRPPNAGKGWFRQVLPQMKDRITERLRYFWDEGVRGPDFLWAAVGPGLESFSAYDEVRRNDGTPFTVGEFLKEVRRITTDFALGQIIHGGTEGLDDWTRYALMHAQNFGTGGAPVGECILLAGAYGLDLGMLTSAKGILTRGKVKATSTDGEDEAADAESSGGGAELRLLEWQERAREDLGELHATGEFHTIDVLHRLMREWASGDVKRAAAYADGQGLGQNDLFWRVAQAFVEMGALQSRERSVLEAIISWGRGRAPSLMAQTEHTQATLEL